MRSARLSPEVFALPVERMREGYYSDAYFNFTKRVLEEQDLHPRVTMQVFQKHQRAIVGGTAVQPHDDGLRGAQTVDAPGAGPGHRLES